MNAMAASTSMTLVLLPACAAGVPTTAARGVLPAPDPSFVEFNVTEVSTFQATVHLPIPPEDLPDANCSKLRIIPRNDRIWVMPVDNEEITVTVKNVDNRTISIDPTVIVSPYSEYVFDEDPFFDMTLTGPDGAATLNLTRVVIRGSINFGDSGCTPLRKVCCGRQEGTSVYTEFHGEYREHYIATTGGSIGGGELEILPRYVEELEYTIANRGGGLNSK